MTLIGDEYVLLKIFGTQDFSDQQHVKNFIRYLFSDSNNHTRTDDTKHNFISEYEASPAGGSRRVAGYFNDDPKALLADFIRRRFDEICNRDEWMNDGFYLAFILPDGEGNLFSNFVEVGADSETGRLVCWDSADEGAMGMVRDHLGSRETMMKTVIVPILKGRGSIRLMEAATPGQRRVIDARLHEVLHSVAGGEVSIAVTHTDQPGQNKSYHIHRIRRRQPGEGTMVTDDMIEGHNRRNLYAEDREATAPRMSSGGFG